MYLLQRTHPHVWWWRVVASHGTWQIWARRATRGTQCAVKSPSQPIRTCISQSCTVGTCGRPTLFSAEFGCQHFLESVLLLLGIFYSIDSIVLDKHLNMCGSIIKIDLLICQHFYCSSYFLWHYQRVYCSWNPYVLTVKSKIRRSKFKLVKISHWMHRK